MAEIGPLPILESAPPADTGQAGVLVRVLSSLAGGGGGGVVQQGAKDASAVPWLVDLNGVPVALDAATLAALETIELGAATLAALETITVLQGTSPWVVGDGAGSLTVDAPVGTPVFVRLSDGAAALIGQKVMAASIPVVIASDQSTVKAREDTAAMTWVSVKSAAPAANALQADTGALAAGDYDFDVQLAVSDTVAVGKGLVLEHRNAANGATLQNLAGAAPTEALQVRLRRYTIAANERLRVIAGTAAGTASSMYISAIGRRIS